MRRRPSVLLPLVVAGLLALAATAPAAHAAQQLSGTSDTERYGKVTLTFTTDPGLVRLTLNAKLARTARGKEIVVECRTDGRYTRVASFRAMGSDNRRMSAPAAVPLKADRCRVRRERTIVATMKMRVRD